MAQARQSVTLETLMTAINTRLVAGTGLNQSYVIMWWGDRESRPRSQAEDLVTYRLTMDSPFKFSGAARAGHLTNQQLEVTVYNRYMSDIISGDILTATRSNFGYYPLMLKVINTFQNLNLFDNYDAFGEPTPTSSRLTVRPLQMIGTDHPIRPKEKDQYWVAGSVVFDMELVQPLTV